MNALDLSIERMAQPRLEAIDKLRAIHKDLIQHKESLTAQSDKLQSLDIETISKRFFTCADVMPAKAQLLETQYPEEKENLISICKHIQNHTFDMLGTGLMEYGSQINWHKDIVADYEWPSDQEFVKMGSAAFDIIIDRENDAELKAPWDLSNMHWIPSLASAYYLTKDDSYVKTFVEDTEDWFRANPPFYGVNWFCPMNISMRAINLIVGITALHPFVEEEFTKKVVDSLYLHGVAIMGYLEIESYSKRNNHYLTNLVGMYFIGQFFKDEEFGQEWLQFAKEELELESPYHFYEDGVIFEDSSCYHRLSAEMLLYSAILGEMNDDSFTDTFLTRLKNSMNFTRDIMQSNNRIPQFGDNDNGRLIQFYGYSTADVNDHRHMLALAGEFFNDDSLRSAGKGAESEAIWTLGEFKAAENSGSTQTKFTEYKDGGYYIVKNSDTTMVIRNGQINKYCGGGHAHCDQLSLTLNHKGSDLLVDPGAYRYSSDFDARNAFRSVEYHNTVQVNSSPMHFYDRETFGGLWWMRDMALSETQTAHFENGIFEFRGSISSYEESDGCTVDRAIDYNDAEKSVTVSDSVTTSEQTPSDTKAYSRYLFGPEIKFNLISANSVELCNNDEVVATLQVINDSAELNVKELWFSPRYGERVTTQQLEVIWQPLEASTLNVKLNLK